MIEFFTTTIRLKDNTKIKLMIWDTAGQERYNSITSSYYNNVIGAFILFDLTKLLSTKKYKKLLLNYCTCDWYSNKRFALPSSRCSKQMIQTYIFLVD